ncbi:MAG: heme-copper oxidase subunit III [Chlamydiae bacterium]|nr:heme-copper oxidase subunit III [Chlamydiota bacterium]MBI3277249.1 heme-copper oxidase subunit III [Chlamydiota bacterium]
MSHAATMNQETLLERPVGIDNAKLATWLFLCSEIMFFAGLIGSYIVLRLGALHWPQPGKILNIPLTGFNTFVLICSSVTMVKAFYWCEMGNQKKLKQHIFSTFLFGVLFLSIQAFEYHKLYVHHGLHPEGNLYGTCFYILTGFHGCHVLGGVIAMFVLLIKSLLGHFTKEHHAPVELVGLYWHFVDLVWIILFTIVYLI